MNSRDMIECPRCGSADLKYEGSTSEKRSPMLGTLFVIVVLFLALAPYDWPIFTIVTILFGCPVAWYIGYMHGYKGGIKLRCRECGCIFENKK